MDDLKAGEQRYFINGVEVLVGPYSPFDPPICKACGEVAMVSKDGVCSDCLADLGAHYDGRES